MCLKKKKEGTFNLLLLQTFRFSSKPCTPGEISMSPCGVTGKWCARMLLPFLYSGWGHRTDSLSWALAAHLMSSNVFLPLDRWGFLPHIAPWTACGVLACVQMCVWLLLFYSQVRPDEDVSLIQYFSYTGGTKKSTIQIFCLKDRLVLQ